MKERLDVFTCKAESCRVKREGEGYHHVRQCVCGRTAGGQGGNTFSDEVQIEIKGHTMPYVSRGGLKLEKAIANFDVDLEGKSARMLVLLQGDLQIVCSRMVRERCSRSM